MTRRSQRDFDRRLGELEDAEEADGFYHIHIGGEGGEGKSGFYTWNDETGA